jgi:hypothetical protein
MAMSMKLILLSVLASIFATTAQAGLISSTVSYLRQFQLGVEFSNYQSSLHLRYEATDSAAKSSTCSGKTSLKTCSITIGDDSNRGYDYGLFLKQPLRRKGWFYAGFDLGFAARYLSGDKTKEALGGEHSFNAIDYSYILLETRPYAQIGITPSNWLPYLLLSAGPMIQYTYGQISIDQQAIYSPGIGSLSRSSLWDYTSFLELEVVFWRISAQRSLSWYTSTVVNDPAVTVTPVFPEQYDDISISGGWFQRSVNGIKFVIGDL